MIHDPALSKSSTLLQPGFRKTFLGYRLRLSSTGDGAVHCLGFAKYILHDTYRRISFDWDVVRICEQAIIILIITSTVKNMNNCQFGIAEENYVTMFSWFVVWNT